MTVEKAARSLVLNKLIHQQHQAGIRQKRCVEKMAVTEHTCNLGDLAYIHVREDMS
jgi:hypothetical protein